MKSGEFLNAVERVYRAGVQPEDWPDALRLLASSFGAVGATLEIFDKRSVSLVDFHLAGLPAGAETPYVEHFARHNPRAAYAMQHLSQKVLFDYRIIDEHGMDRDPYYAEYLTSIDLRYFITAQIIDTPLLHGVVSIQRSRRQGHVQDSDVAIMKRLLPHLRRAYDITVRLQSAGRARRAFESGFDWLDDGVAIVDVRGTVCHANDALQAIVRRDDGIRMTKGGLEFASAQASHRFTLALASADLKRDVAETAAGDFFAERASGTLPYRVSVRPLVEFHAVPGVGDEPFAIVFISDPLAAGSAAVTILRDAFGLTSAEARLASALQRGISPIAYARRNGISANTVYTHLRRLREKTNTRRQSELIHRLNALGPLRSLSSGRTAK